MDYEFQRHRSDKIPREKVLEELEKVARNFNYREFSSDEFNDVSKISPGTVKNTFGSWHKALTALKDKLREKDLDLSPRKSRSNLLNPTEEQLLEEMDRVWKKLGHRPSSTEWKNSNPAFSYGTYRYKFNGWSNACLKFIEHKMGGSIVVEPMTEKTAETDTRVIAEGKAQHVKISYSRNIPMSMRIRVLDRDNFRCVFCGRSPATDLGIKLHIDHIVPFSKGGKTTLENLQTLCQECNLGKSDKENIGSEICRQRKT
ncbi:MAG: HNH endonuclease domain protein [Parcubacteria group bacterium GW2011_GWA2_47_64]|nr:MAG: HNH endonuclease domain protein [Parcubacteria group bacterium GW2011_GWA2_47_64]KKU96469.1 MAG: HNH endonuclease domain protein [Parcubacteria group bacterium GW2011_GWC2_48_17]